MKLSQLLPGVGEEIAFYGACFLIILLFGFVLGECHGRGPNMDPAIAADTVAANLYKRDALRAHNERDSLASVNRVLVSRHVVDSIRADSLHAVAIAKVKSFVVINPSRGALPSVNTARDTGSRPAVDTAGKDTVAYLFVVRQSDARRFTVPRFLFDAFQSVVADDSAQTANYAGEHALAINYSEQLEKAKAELASTDSANASTARALARAEKAGHSAFGVKTGIVLGIVAAAAVPKAPQALGHLGTQVWQLIIRGKL